MGEVNTKMFLLLTGGPYCAEVPAKFGPTIVGVDTVSTPVAEWATESTIE